MTAAAGSTAAASVVAPPLFFSFFFNCSKALKRANQASPHLRESLCRAASVSLDSPIQEENAGEMDEERESKREKERERTKLVVVSPVF